MVLCSSFPYDDYMKKSVGRPMKYDSVLYMIRDDVVYSPASIAKFAESIGYFAKILDPKEVKKKKLRLRTSMGRFSNNHSFPDQGDGTVRIKGQSPTPGWFGWRWKAALRR